MPQTASQLAQNLLAAIADEGPKLAALSESDSQTRDKPNSGWSRRQELGHLVDSATNNRVRFAAAALAGKFVGPSYDGEGWVKLGGYDQMTWSAILDLWTQQNTALATLIANIPDENLLAPCEIAGPPSVTLAFLIEDYVLHMQHHLDHVLGREVSTSYPGAAMGV